MAASVKVTGGNRWQAALDPYLKRDGSGVFIGAYTDASYTTEDARHGHKVAEYLAYHEFGTSRTPVRAPLRNAAAQHGSEWVKEAANMLKATKDAQKALNIAGDKAASAIRDFINDGHAGPALNERTVERKRQKRYPHAETPLVETGTMMKAIRSKWIDDLSTLGNV